jgi:hypothetical protein
MAAGSPSPTHFAPIGATYRAVALALGLLLTGFPVVRILAVRVIVVGQIQKEFRWHMMVHGRCPGCRR